MDWNGAFFSLMALGKFVRCRILCIAEPLRTDNRFQLPKTLLTCLEVCCISFGTFGFGRPSPSSQHTSEYDLRGFADLIFHSSCILELGIFTSHLIWLFRTRHIRKEAAAQGKTFDDIAAEDERSGVPFKFAERKSRKERHKLAKENKDLEASMGASLGNLELMGENATKDAATPRGDV